MSAQPWVLLSGAARSREPSIVPRAVGFKSEDDLGAYRAPLAICREVLDPHEGAGSSRMCWGKSASQPAHRK